MHHQATPYLMFQGQARDALDFYTAVFKGEVVDIQTYGEADFPTPPEADGNIIHATFKKETLLLMVSDAFPGQTIEAGNQISLALEMESNEEIEEIYASLSEKGTAIMELQDTFWGAKYAKVKDPCGITWDLNYKA